ncbi:MAG: hypothetical protein ABIH26_04750 [Candidatus Eisenbacteria bacterium]
MRMNFNVVLGVAAIGYGVFTIYARVTNRPALGKLDAMRQKWGSLAGTVIHVIVYTVLPILVGVVLLVRGLSAE